MKVKKLIFILLCVSIALPKTQQIASQKFRMGMEDEEWTKVSSIRFDELILESLNFLQLKLVLNTFTDEDMRILAILMEFILKMNENIKRRRQREQTVYWLTRQGR